MHRAPRRSGTAQDPEGRRGERARNSQEMGRYVCRGRAEERGCIMSGAVTIVIGGEPVAKGRPRATRRGILYTPAHTRKYEAHGRLAAQLAMGERPPIEGPVRLELL